MKNSEFISQYKPTLSLRLSFSWLCRVSDFFSATRKQVLSSSSLDLFSSKECSSIRLVIWYLSRASTADARLVSKAFSLAWVWTKSQTLIYIKYITLFRSDPDLIITEEALNHDEDFIHFLGKLFSISYYRKDLFPSSLTWDRFSLR